MQFFMKKTFEFQVPPRKLIDLNLKFLVSRKKNSYPAIFRFWFYSDVNEKIPAVGT